VVNLKYGVNYPYYSPVIRLVIWVETGTLDDKTDFGIWGKRPLKQLAILIDLIRSCGRLLCLSSDTSTCQITRSDKLNVRTSTLSGCVGNLENRRFAVTWVHCARTGVALLNWNRCRKSVHWLEHHLYSLN
jgi:hypothetical protein